MTANKVSARAPSNIALIKYMGKKAGNLPENASLSLTLHDLCSFAELSEGQGQSQWISEVPKVQNTFLDLVVPKLDAHGIQRIMKHVERVREKIEPVLVQYGLPNQTHKGVYQLRTANTFPAGSGIASSASSFAAVTLAAAAFFSESDLFKKAWQAEEGLRKAVAQISREGSGSSCRSFEGPWVLWEGETAGRIKTEMQPLAHFVILFEASQKKVSSSEAHARVKTSPLWQGGEARSRPQRAQARLHHMMQSMKVGDLRTVAEIAWSEAWEMHSLFHTCDEPFSYWVGGTMDALQWFRTELFDSTRKSFELPPAIVTLDAGPNLHVLVEAIHQELWFEKLKHQFPKVSLLRDQEGKGAHFVETGEGK